MGRSDFLYGSFRSHFRYEPTSCQDSLFRDVADFLTGDDGDILTVNGYAGTGKTTAVSAVIASMNEFKVPVVLLAPTGRAAKVLSLYSGRPAGIQGQDLGSPSCRCEKHDRHLEFVHRGNHGRYSSGLAGAGISVDSQYVPIISCKEIGHIPEKGVLAGGWLVPEMAPEAAVQEIRTSHITSCRF